jgi:hypothetical protein
MRTAGSMRRVVRDRVRWNPVVVADHPQAHKIRPWTDTAPIASAADSAAKTEDDRAVQRSSAAMMVVLGVTVGALVGLVGSNMLQEILLATGLGSEPAVETVLRKQAAAISRLDATVGALNAAVAGLTARADFAGDQEEATRQRIAKIDDDLGALRSSMSEVRAAQAAAAEEPWRKPVARLEATVLKARSDIIGLRASLHESAPSRTPNLAAIGDRIDRLEQALVQHSLLAPIRGSIPGQPRPPALRGSSPEETADGHIIDLTAAAQ